MMYKDQRRSFAKSATQHLKKKPVESAQRFIARFQQIESPNEKQCLMLAAAHYTIANQLDISLPICRLHANSAIAVLQNIHNQKNIIWQSQIAQAYFKRAELLEEENAYSAALFDYHRTLQSIENHALTNKPHSLNTTHKLMLAKSAISIADLMINEPIDFAHFYHTHPLFYINKALEYLKQIEKHDEEIYAIRAYAHQLAGITLNMSDFYTAEIELQQALHMAFKTKPSNTYHLLADIYNCLGLLYESKFSNNMIQNPNPIDIETAMIYFSMAILFTKAHAEEDENFLNLESLFGIVHRVSDPFLPGFSRTILLNLIDGLIFAYIELFEDILPNQHIQHHYTQPETLDTLVQYIYWLMFEVYRNTYPVKTTLTVFDPNTLDTHLDTGQILLAIQNSTLNNVYCFHNFKPNVKI